MRAKLSLKAKGLQLLAQREHSRAELRRKLLAYARAQHGAEQSVDSPAEIGVAAPAEPVPLAEQVDEALDALAARGYLSEARFIESRLHVRASRYGAQRIRQELAQHGVALSGEQAEALRQTELARAQAVWQRKFGQPPADAAERARQMRFLLGRGFSGDVIRRVLQGGEFSGDDA